MKYISPDGLVHYKLDEDFIDDGLRATVCELDVREYLLNKEPDECLVNTIYETSDLARIKQDSLVTCISCLMHPMLDPAKDE